LASVLQSFLICGIIGPGIAFAFCITCACTHVSNCKARDQVVAQVRDSSVLFLLFCCHFAALGPAIVVACCVCPLAVGAVAGLQCAG
jgi:hypothetical protein